VVKGHADGVFVHFAYRIGGGGKGGGVLVGVVVVVMVVETEQ